MAFDPLPKLTGMDCGGKSLQYGWGFCTAQSELIEIAERFDSMLLVDEAHATGVWGSQGRGLTEPYENHPNVIAVHTCGKALGAAGALVCTSAKLIKYLINKSRPFIYSTAPPPINAIAVSAALDLIDSEPERREQLHELIVLANLQMESKFEMKGSGSQIIPFISRRRQPCNSSGRDHAKCRI